MKKTLVLMLALAVVATGCFGAAARDNVLLPAMNLAWEGVEKSIHAGITDASDAGDINQATVDVLLQQATALKQTLADGDREGLRAVDWPSLQGYALRGVTARATRGEIGVTVAKILMERISQFNKSYIKALER